MTNTSQTCYRPECYGLHAIREKAGESGRMVFKQTIVGFCNDSVFIRTSIGQELILCTFSINAM